MAVTVARDATAAEKPKEAPVTASSPKVKRLGILLSGRFLVPLFSNKT